MSKDGNSPCICYKLALDANYEPGQTSRRTLIRWAKMLSKARKARRIVTQSEGHLSTDDLPPSVSHMNEAGENNDDWRKNDYYSDESDFENNTTDDETNEKPDSTPDLPTGANHIQHDNSKAEPISSSDSNACFIEDSDRIMFHKSKLTVRDVVEMVVAYSLRFGNSQEARQMLIEMIKIFAGPEFKDFNISNYKLSQIFDPPPDKITYHFYCHECAKKVLHSSPKNGIKGQKLICEECESEHIIRLSNPSYFISLDLEYQLRLLLEREEIVQYFIPNIPNEDSGNANVMSDVNDSILHKRIIEKYSIIITYVISTDGAPLFNISKRGFWPLQILLNDLPAHLRFKFVLLVGLMIVKSEPKPDLMNLFINEFVKQANRLNSEGMKANFVHLKRDVILRFTPIFVVADSVARPVLQNRLQYNGYYGCSYCYHKGFYIYKKGMKYPFLAEEPENRTHDSHMQDVAAVCNSGGLSFRGVKGESAFINLHDIDMVWGFPLDYLHNALFGVTEQVWTSWCTILTPAQRKKVDALLLLIQPPRDLRRCPEKLSCKSIWKATHWKAWLLFFSLPICATLIESQLLEHFALFVNSMFLLLKTKITENELDKCEQDLLFFVGNYELLYGKERMTFNIHALQHLVSSVRQSGPLWATSAFPFEHNIHFLKQTFSGPKSVEQQMSVKSLNLLKYQIRPVSTEISRIAKQYCEAIFFSKTFTKSAVTTGNITFFGPDQQNIFESVTEKEFERCIFNNCVFSSTRYQRSKKFNDTAVLLNSGDFAQITGIFLLPDETCSFHINKLIIEPFFVGSTQVEHIWGVKNYAFHAPISPTNIKSKAVVLNLENCQYVCEIPNAIEAQ